MSPTANDLTVLPQHNVLSKTLTLANTRLVIRPSSVKRIFDTLFALLVVCLIISWLLPIIALLIKFDSRGPVFFRQLRTGRHGRPFYCLKFRSMRPNDDADSRQACRGDSRVTTIGAFLRKTSLDELPQFINVLRGEMSVVGPRPHMIAHTEHYAGLIDNFMERHLIAPGITGLAQVTGLRGEIGSVDTMLNRLNADIHYLQHWSFWLDMKIIVLTAFQVTAKNEHAY